MALNDIVINVNFKIQLIPLQKKDIFFTNISETSAEASSGQQAEGHGKIHKGIICDGCNGPVKGTRYKCMECDDFDLCALCEEKGAHQDHDMMKITKPNRTPFYAVPHKGPGMQRHGMGRCGGPGGQGEVIIKLLEMYMKL